MNSQKTMHACLAFVLLDPARGQVEFKNSKALHSRKWQPKIRKWEHSTFAPSPNTMDKSESYIALRPSCRRSP